MQRPVCRANTHCKSICPWLQTLSLMTSFRDKLSLMWASQNYRLGSNQKGLILWRAVMWSTGWLFFVSLNYTWKMLSAVGEETWQNSWQIIKNWCLKLQKQRKLKNSLTSWQCAQHLSIYLSIQFNRVLQPRSAEDHFWTHNTSNLEAAGLQQQKKILSVTPVS